MEDEILKLFNKTTATISAISTAFTTIFGVEWILFAGYLILNVLDYITGTIKAKVKKVENSNKGLIGIVKKVCYWILIGIAFLISFLLTQIGVKINLNLDFIMLFGWFTLVCLIVNEARSIVENLVEIGIEVPVFLRKGLEVYNKLIESTLNNIMDFKKKNGKN